MTGQVTSSPSMNISQSKSGSRFVANAMALASCASWVTLLTPIEEPSCGGLTIRGKPSSWISLAMFAGVCSLGGSQIEAGVDKCSARHRRLVICLSMAIAEAITPEPVYGIPINSKAPCTVPSSPCLPCKVIKAWVYFSAFNCSSASCAGSKAVALTPSDCNAVRTP